MLAADRERGMHIGGGNRTRSVSGSSTMLLNRHVPSDGRTSVGLESASGIGAAEHSRSFSGSAHTPTTPGAATPFSYAAPELHDATPVDPFYRPPRARRPTADSVAPAPRGRFSWVLGDGPGKRWSSASRRAVDTRDPAAAAAGPSVSGRGTPVPAHVASREPSDAISPSDARRPNTDYAVREMDSFYGVREADYYYGVRGPALSHMSTRRLKTGPADPTGPIASAAGWFKGLFGAKTKEKGKGFEVVRSSRMPPPTTPRALAGGSTPTGVGGEGRYRDDVDADTGPSRGHTDGRDEASLVDIGPSAQIGVAVSELSEDGRPRPLHSRSGSELSGEHDLQVTPVSPVAPVLPGIETGGGIELPDRTASRTTGRPAHGAASQDAPALPRKSSKRRQQSFGVSPPDTRRLPTIRGSSPSSPVLADAESAPTFHFQLPSESPAGSSPRLPFGSEQSSLNATGASSDGDSRASSGLPPLNSDGDGGAPTTVLGPQSRPFASGPDRPTSMGFVAQGRAHDHIHLTPADGAAGFDFRPSTAEIVDDAGSRSGSTGSRNTTTTTGGHVS